MKKLLIAVVCVGLLGCETIRMKYESQVVVDGQNNKFTYENSYPVGGAFSSLCYITGIFVGGTCWYYLVMPTVQQKALIAEDANDYLSKKLAGKKYEETFQRVSKVNYSEGDEMAELRVKERPNSDNPVVP